MLLLGGKEYSIPHNHKAGIQADSPRAMPKSRQAASHILGTLVKDSYNLPAFTFRTLTRYLDKALSKAAQYLRPEITPYHTSCFCEDSWKQTSDQVMPEDGKGPYRDYIAAWCQVNPISKPKIPRIVGLHCEPAIRVWQCWRLNKARKRTSSWPREGTCE
jgi:hypothetical protein